MTDDDLKRLLEANAERIENGFAGVENKLATIDKKLDDSVAEMRRHFDATAERQDKKIDALAESIAAVDEKLDRRCDDIDQRMERGFADTQAMIKFSHAELDRRVRRLEESVSDLETRVERLESSPH